MKPQSKSEIDQLGETLKHTPVSEASLIALEQFRCSFESAIAKVQHALKNYTDVQSTLRPSKSTPSIIAKLNRQPTLRLSQIQDIAGLRIIVLNRAQQDALYKKVLELYPNSKHHDRREKPSFGYRAVHVIMKVDGALVELQIRTEGQHMWAQLAERLADTYGHELKYGKGNVLIERFLTVTAEILNISETSDPHSKTIRQDFEVSLQTALSNVKNQPK